MARLALICVGSAVPMEKVGEYWVMKRRLLPHAQRSLEYVICETELEYQDNRNIYNVFHNLGLLYDDQNELEEAEAKYQRALKGYEKAWGPEHTETLGTVNNMGLLYAD